MKHITRTIIIATSSLVIGLGTYALLRKDKPEDVMNVPYSIIVAGLGIHILNEELKDK